MDRVFSVDDDRFWSHPPPVHQSTQNSSNLMNRSSSEWAFQRFLQEASASEPSPTSSSSKDVVQIKDQAPPPPARTTTTATAGHPNVPIDSEEYQAFLKSRLSLACAAVASRASCVKPLETAPPLAESGSQTNNASQTGSQVSAKGSSGGFDDNPKGPSNKDGSGVTPIGVPSLPSLQKKSPVQVKSTTSGSSRDQSDDDDLDLDTETTQNNDPLDVKRVRRMLSNRESARRSRRRKQAHLTELETQVSQLRVENSTLLKRLSDVTQKYSEAAVDNRVLKADVETLRAKVKMAEETVKRVTGLNPLFQAMSEMSTAGIPSFDCSPSDTSTDAAPPVHDDHQQQHQQQQQHFYHHHNPASASSNNSSNPMSNHDQMVQNSMVDMHVPDNAAEVGGNKMGRTSSMQRVASLEHLQKRIRGGVGGGSCGSGGNQQQS